MESKMFSEGLKIKRWKNDVCYKRIKTLKRLEKENIERLMKKPKNISASKE